MLTSERFLRGAELCMSKICKRVRGWWWWDDEGPGLVVNRGMLEEIEMFCYLGDVLGCEGGVERAVQARVTAAWRRWWEIVSLLVTPSIGQFVWDLVNVYCIEQKHGHWQAAWWMFFADLDVIAGCSYTWQEWSGKMGGLRDILVWKVRIALGVKLSWSMFNQFTKRYFGR